MRQKRKTFDVGEAGVVQCREGSTEECDLNGENVDASNVHCDLIDVI